MGTKRTGVGGKKREKEEGDNPSSGMAARGLRRRVYMIVGDLYIVVFCYETEILLYVFFDISRRSSTCSLWPFPHGTPHLCL